MMMQESTDWHQVSDVYFHNAPTSFKSRVHDSIVLPQVRDVCFPKALMDFISRYVFDFKLCSVAGQVSFSQDVKNILLSLAEIEARYFS